MLGKKKVLSSVLELKSLYIQLHVRKLRKQWSSSCSQGTAETRIIFRNIPDDTDRWTAVFIELNIPFFGGGEEQTPAFYLKFQILHILCRICLQQELDWALIRKRITDGRILNHLDERALGKTFICESRILVKHLTCQKHHRAAQFWVSQLTERVWCLQDKIMP